MTAQNTLFRELEDALSHGSADRREKTLRRVTDLFVFGSSHFSGDHIAVFDGVFSHLVADIEQSARAALAERLAAIPNAPPTLIRTLAFDDAIEVAGAVLTQSEQLDNVSLVENAKTKSQQHLLAITLRKSLAETVTDVLVERGGRDVALSVAQNAGAKFSEAGYVRLVKRSEHDDELARSVGSRPEIPRHHFLKLLSTASKAVRLALEGAHPEHAGEIKQVVAKVATAIQEKAGGHVPGLCRGACPRRGVAGVGQARGRRHRAVCPGRQLRGYRGRARDPVCLADRCCGAHAGAGSRGNDPDRREGDGAAVADGEGAAAASGWKGRPLYSGA